MPRRGKPKKGLKVESLQLLARTEGLAETSTKRGLEVRGGVLSLPKMTTGLSISGLPAGDRKSTRLNSSHGYISYAVFCLKKKNRAAGTQPAHAPPRRRSG